MSTSSLPSSSLTAASGMVPFGQFVSDIAVYFGMDNDPEKESWIGRIVHDVIDDLNRKKLWQFNLIQAADITTSPGTDTYSVPGDVWRVYSLRKSNDIDYLLTGMQQRTFDIVFQSQNQITGFPFVRTDFNIYRDGTFKVFPTPDGIHTLQLRYFRLIGKPGSDQDFLDMPPPYQSVPKYGALARVAAMVGTNMVIYWKGMFDEAYLDMDRADESIVGDEDLRFINIEEMDSRNSSYLNPALRPRFLDFY